jgi:hypothetical protein
MWEYLALPGGPGRFKRDFSCPAILGNSEHRTLLFQLQAYHLLWGPFPEASSRACLGNCVVCLAPDLSGPTTPFIQRHQALTYETV